MWLVRVNLYHPKDAAVAISGHLIVPSGDKDRGQRREEMQEKEVERIQSY